MGVLLPGKRGRILSTIYLPEGSAPFPVILICHGLPGIERLMDFAIYLREKGFCTVTFHYSGCFGSDGTYSFVHCLEDTDSVLDYVQRNSDGLFDLSRAYILGHSLGGLMASYGFATRDWLKAGTLIMPGSLAENFHYAALAPEKEEEMRTMYQNVFAPWLNGFSWEENYEDAQVDMARIDLTTYAEKIADKPTLLIAGTLDKVIDRTMHLDKLVAAIKSFHRGYETVLEFKTDHGINMQREQIRQVVADFFIQQDRVQR